jgi:DNA sulfur modification protein DndE
MSDLQLKRIRFSKEADNWLRTLKSRTGVTPNLLCRIGFCLSLEERSDPVVAKYLEDSDREINRYTLLGEYDAVFVALLKQRIGPQDVADTELDDSFKAHMNRGIMLLASRLRVVGDLQGLINR